MEGKKFVSFKYKYCVELVYINKYIHARYLTVYAMNFLIGLCTVLTKLFLYIQWMCNARRPQR